MLLRPQSRQPFPSLCSAACCQVRIPQTSVHAAHGWPACVPPQQRTTPSDLLLLLLLLLCALLNDPPGQGSGITAAGERMALNIFEPRYRLMVRRCMEGDHCFGVATVGRNQVLSDIACQAEIMECHPLPDGCASDLSAPRYPLGPCDAIWHTLPEGPTTSGCAGASTWRSWAGSASMWRRPGSRTAIAWPAHASCQTSPSRSALQMACRWCSCAPRSRGCLSSGSSASGMPQPVCITAAILLASAASLADRLSCWAGLTPELALTLTQHPRRAAAMTAHSGAHVMEMLARAGPKPAMHADGISHAEALSFWVASLLPTSTAQRLSFARMTSTAERLQACPCVQACSPAAVHLYLPSICRLTLSGAAGRAEHHAAGWRLSVPPYVALVLEGSAAARDPLDIFFGVLRPSPASLDCLLQLVGRHVPSPVSSSSSSSSRPQLKNQVLQYSAALLLQLR